MGFKITIVETKLVPKVETDSFLVEERPLTDQEVDEQYPNYYRDPDKVRQMKKVYSPQEVQSTKEIETKVFEQTVETLDLKAVIQAVNK